MKATITIVVTLCLLYFVLGYIAVWFEFLNNDHYLALAGIIGGVASVAGLMSLLRPAISRDSLQALESETLRSLSETTKQLKILEAERLRARSDIGDLEIKQKEMELLVKKASTALFLREQCKYFESKILTAIESDENLSDYLSKLSELTAKLSVLDEEIETNPNVQILNEVMDAANDRQGDFRRNQHRSPFEMAISQLAEIYIDLFKSILRK